MQLTRNLKTEKMSKIKYLVGITLGTILSFAFFSSCEIDEPFVEPNASFEVWGVNPETNTYELQVEPYVLIANTPYDFVVKGDGESFVFWFGADGDPEKTSPSGSNFEDRGLNHYSSGDLAVNGSASNTYKEGAYTLTFVASSYSYVEDEYKEQIIQKEITVVAAK